MNAADTIAMKPAREYAISRVQWAWLGVALAVLLVMFWSTFQVIWQHWHREEYSHGFLVPLISLLLIWQKRRQLQQLPFTGSWVGVALALGGVGLYFVSHYGGLALIDAYALVIVIAGLILAVMGWKAFAVILPAVALLFLMVPLPTFFFNKLSSFLQLISSQLGVAVIRAFDISVFLQGNVIDLGSYKLQVVEACSGLRYLFPLLTLGIIIACVVRLPLWIKTVVVLSTIPVTILMNSFRIGVIGLLVDRYGIAQAEGFLHDFEGWAIFMACFAVLMIEIWALVRFTGDKRSLRDILAIDWPAARPATARVDHRAMHAPLIAGVAAVTLGSLGALTLPYQQEIKPERTWFSAFPLELGAWRGHREALENDVLSTLMLDDYILADYVSAGEPPVNFYVAYYASQRSNASAHSPSSCLPGGGWRISEFAPREVPLPASAGRASVKVNRAIIQQGDQRQLVYYWFKERSRNITSEYVVKWYLLLDSLRQHRSDGALVRLVTPLTDGEDIKQADARLMQFSGYVAPLLTQFVPD